jgi:hypothetical protein
VLLRTFPPAEVPNDAQSCGIGFVTVGCWPRAEIAIAATNVSVTLTDFLTPDYIALFRPNGDKSRQWAKDASERAGFPFLRHNPSV